MRRETDEAENDDSLVTALSSLREVTPPPSLVAGTMRRITEQPPAGFWNWLRRPRQFVFRLSPVAIGVFGLTLTALGIVMVRDMGHRDSRSIATSVVTSSQPEMVLVRFVLVTKGPHKVSLAGDFNAWNAEQTPLQDVDGQGTYAASVWLPRGSHEYMFVVDGEWMPDPLAMARVPDGFGRANSVLRL
jgi:hypothetical protein